MIHLTIPGNAGEIQIFCFSSITVTNHLISKLQQYSGTPLRDISTLLHNKWEILKTIGEMQQEMKFRRGCKMCLLELCCLKKIKGKKKIQ